MPFLVAQTTCSDGIYPVSGVCNEFYQCSNGQKTEKQVCPAGLFFNPDNGVCDYPENVDCDRKLFLPNLNRKEDVKSDFQPILLYKLLKKRMKFRYVLE